MKSPTSQVQLLGLPGQVTAGQDAAVRNQRRKSSISCYIRQPPIHGSRSNPNLNNNNNNNNNNNQNYNSLVFNSGSSSNNNNMNNNNNFVANNTNTMGLGSAIKSTLDHDQFIVSNGTILGNNNNNNNNINVINRAPRNVTATLSVNPALLVHRRSVIGRVDRLASFHNTQRLSDVGVAVGQQITAKMGLKLPASQERIVDQTRWLYLRYIFDKLRQKGLPMRDLNLTKSLQARRAAALGKVTNNNNNKITRLASQSAPSSANIISSNQDPAMARLGLPLEPQSNGTKDAKPRLGRPVGERCAFRLSQFAPPDELKNLTSNHLQKLKGDKQLPLLSSSNFNYNNINNNNNNRDPLDYSNNASPTSEQAPQMQAPLTSQETITSSGMGANFELANSSQNRKYIMDSTINSQILAVIMSINKELHDTQPELYDDSIYELIGIDKFSSIEDLLEVQKRICQEMTRTEISWCRIVALFSLFGSMSLDCVRLGSPEHVGPILDGFLGFVERDLALWISQQGGWEAFLYKFRANVSFTSILYRIMIISCPVIVWFLMNMINNNAN